jgi:hypothetical protein
VQNLQGWWQGEDGTHIVQNLQGWWQGEDGTHIVQNLQGWWQGEDGTRRVGNLQAGQGDNLTEIEPRGRTKGTTECDRGVKSELYIYD